MWTVAGNVCCVHWTSFRANGFCREVAPFDVLQLLPMQWLLISLSCIWIVLKLFLRPFRSDSPFVPFNCTILCECCGFSGFHSCGLLISRASKKTDFPRIVLIHWHAVAVLACCAVLSWAQARRTKWVFIRVSMLAPEVF